MIIFNFVEGAWPRKGGAGIACVPKIGQSLAGNGVHVVLISGGPPTPGYEGSVVANATLALQNNFDRGSFAILRLWSWGKYAFSPAAFCRAGWHVRKADVVALHSVYSFPVLAGYILARFWHKPYVLWPHGVLAPFMRGIGYRKKWFYDRLIARKILRGASAVICTGETERIEVESLNLTERGIVIPHGIALRSYASLPERGRFRSQYLCGHQGPLVLYLGRLAAVKNLELLIRAFAQILPSVPDARLALVGPPDPDSFDRTVTGWLQEHGVADRTVLTGPITDLRAKQEALVDADVFVMPSHAENFCHALFEAMAAGLPAVVSDSLNYASQVAGNQAGLAAAREPEEFANAILKLLRNPDLRRAMGHNGRRMAAEYSWEKSGERIARTLQAVVRSQPLPEDLVRYRTPRLEPVRQAEI